MGGVLRVRGKEERKKREEVRVDFQGCEGMEKGRREGELGWSLRVQWKGGGWVTWELVTRVMWLSCREMYVGFQC